MKSVSTKEYLLAKSLPLLNQLSPQDRGALGTFQLLGHNSERYAVDFTFSSEWKISSIRKLA